MIFEASWGHEKRVRQPVTFTVVHVNRPPVVEDLPVFYVRQSTNNVYQVPSEFAYDPDGDPLVFKSIQSQMPEGAGSSSREQLRNVVGKACIQNSNDDGEVAKKRGDYGN